LSRGGFFFFSEIPRLAPPFDAVLDFVVVMLAAKMEAASMSSLSPSLLMEDMFGTSWRGYYFG